MKKTKIHIDKIYHNVTKTGKDKFTLVAKFPSGNLAFSGWGRGEVYKEGQDVEITYDENSKYQGKSATYYNLIQPKTSSSGMKEVMEKLDMMEKLLLAIDTKVSGGSLNIPEMKPLDKYPTYDENS